MNILLTYHSLVASFDSYDKSSNRSDQGIGIISPILKIDDHEGLFSETTRAKF